MLKNPWELLLSFPIAHPCFLTSEEHLSLFPPHTKRTCTHTCFLIFISIPQALSRKGENASRKRDICQVSSRAISPCQLLVIIPSAPPPPIWQCSGAPLCFTVPNRPVRVWDGGIIRPTWWRLWYFQNKNKLRLGTVYHPETDIQLPKDNKDTDNPLWIKPSISNIWTDGHINCAFQHSRIWNTQLLLAIKHKLSVFSWAFTCGSPWNASGFKEKPCFLWLKIIIIITFV